MADILHLPPELCVRIASFLTTVELAPFRRSCKQIEANLFDSFASEFFTKRQFMLEHVSLEALLGIANHPGLAARLSEVIISTHLLWNADTPLQRDMFLMTGMAGGMLAEAFSKLPNLRVVGLRDYDGAGRVRDGPHARWRSWGWSMGTLKDGQAQDLLPIILMALGSSGARPTAIEGILRRCHLAAPQSFSIPSPGIASNVLPVLQSLKTIFLPISAASTFYEGAPWNTYDDSNSTELALRRFIHYMPQLETLRLNFEPYQFLAYRLLHWLGKQPISHATPDLQGPAIPPVLLSNLTVLNIGMAFVSGPTLVQLFAKFDLVSFSLWKMNLECPGPLNQYDPWADFLLKLSKTLPSPNRLRSILIGHAGQFFCQPNHSHTITHEITKFVPTGTDADKKFKATKDMEVRFKSQYTAQTANAWLEELSARTYVAGIHVDPNAPRRQSPDSDEDGDDDTDDFEEPESSEADDDD